MSTIFEARSQPIEFTKGQREALEKVETFLKSDNNFFLLAGYSGCGKTTIAENIAKFSNAKMMTPTNAAVNRLAEKINVPANRFSTIHRVMYSPKDDSGQFRKSKEMDPKKVYIVDECSMIDKRVLDDLLTDAQKKESKIIFMGE